jgi:hypothetical protein
MIATYRGVKYDTESIKDKYTSWWNSVHHDASKRLTYRGNDYRPVKTSESVDNCYG